MEAARMEQFTASIKHILNAARRLWNDGLTINGGLNHTEHFPPVVEPITTGLK